jgi:hypothetical protein
LESRSRTQNLPQWRTCCWIFEDHHPITSSKKGEKKERVKKSSYPLIPPSIVWALQNLHSVLGLIDIEWMCVVRDSASFSSCSIAFLFVWL